MCIRDSLAGGIRPPRVGVRALRAAARPGVRRTVNHPVLGHHLAVGYAMFDTPPPDFHAMFEAYVGGRWELFDPTRMSEPRDLVLIATGRDAKDVAFATIFGDVRMTRKELTVDEGDVTPPPSDSTTPPVLTVVPA